MSCGDGHVRGGDVSCDGGDIACDHDVDRESFNGAYTQVC